MDLGTVTNGNVSPELADLLRKISSGNAVLFLGSGFSADARGVGDEDMPLAAPLANSIGDLGNFDGEGDLRYAADRFLDNYDPRTLIQFLRQNFTVKSIQQHHKDIAAAHWRRIYTTNYDLCFERSAADSGRVVTTVDISDAPASYAGMSDLCVHINGSINSLSTDSINNSFKLSTASYLSPDSFLTSSWHFPFQRDLEFCSAIVFVGYSMYDIEIQKILHENEHYAQKTYFITRPSAKERSNYTLSKFGKILPISTKGLGYAIANSGAANDVSSTELMLASLWLYEPKEKTVDVRDSDVDSFLMRGEIEDYIIDSALAQNTGSPILINRSELLYAKEMLSAGANIVITADFGNGKSVFLRQLRSLLARESFSVFTADFKDSHQHDDLDQLIKSGKKSFLIIDSYEQNIELVRHFAEQNPSNVQLILGARTNIHERCRTDLTERGLTLSEVVIDDLESEEIDQFIDIVTNAGYWGEKAALAPATKRDLIVNTHKKQLSLNLLGLLESPQMISRVKNLLEPFLSNSRRKDTIFAIALLSTNDFPLTSSLISDIAMNNEIFTAELRADEKFNQLFHIKGSRVDAKSSLFALALISHQFPSTYIVDQLLKIVEMLGDTRSEVQERRDIQKSLLRFSIVERLLPERHRKQNLVRYYEQVKLKISWLQTDPHFWLQYGMSQLTYKEYDKAQGFFKQAYAFAAQRHDYHTIQIDTQQARLFILRALEAPDSASAQGYFTDANQLIRKLPSDAQTFRQVERYRDVFDQIYSKFSGGGKAYFEQACRGLLADVNNAIRDWEGTIARSRVPLRVKAMLEKILADAKAARKPK